MTHIEKRNFPRFAFTAEAMLAIMMPQETFTPLAIRSVVSDISLTGLQLKTYQLGKNDYLELIKRVHFAKVAFDFPDMEESVQVHASIVWVDYHDRSNEDQAHCLLGLKFERFLGASEELLRKGLEGVSSPAPGSLKAPEGKKLR